MATTSLNRPGASDYTVNFIKRRQGQEKIDLIDPVIAPILESTYGIMLYQEQVMQIAQAYAGLRLEKPTCYAVLCLRKISLKCRKWKRLLLQVLSN